MTQPPTEWKTKPTDRFILKWIKLNLSARISPRIAARPEIRPWMITAASASLGVLGGLFFGLGYALAAGCLAALGQILDGVDGQVARLTGTASPAGAFLDSVLDRYADGAMVIGLTVYLYRLPWSTPGWVVLILGSLAVMGSNLVSYSTARAETLHLDLGRPTLASKGARTAVMVVCAWGGGLFWPPLPAAALIYLAIHPNLTALGRVIGAHRRNS
ncbi:MAG: CDP-alcohol phosphatidyltransferase family protein [Pseudomonadota bacterium]